MSNRNLPSPSPARGRLALGLDPRVGEARNMSGPGSASRVGVESSACDPTPDRLWRFDARIGPEAGQVCQSFTVVWNCRPGSALAQAACPIFSHSARVFWVLPTLPGLVRQVRSQSPSASTALRNSSVTRTELLEFWPETVR